MNTFVFNSWKDFCLVFEDKWQDAKYRVFHKKCLLKEMWLYYYSNFVFYSPQKILCITLKWECAKIGRYPNFQLQNVLWGMFQYLNILSWPCEDHVFNRHVAMEGHVSQRTCPNMTPDLTWVQVDFQACDWSIEEFAVFSLVKTSSCTPWLWQRFITDAKEGEGVFFLHNFKTKLRWN